MVNEVSKSIQDVDKKISNIEKKFSKKMEIMGKKNQVEILAVKASINQIKTIVDGIINRQD
jgi:hypothetical protein